MQSMPFARDGKWGLKTESGSIVCPATFDAMDSFFEGLARVVVGRQEGFVDAEGSVVVPLKFARVTAFSEGLAVFGEGWIGNELSKWGYIDRFGNIAIEARFDDASKFSCGLAAVTVGGRMGVGSTGYVDRQGNWRIQPRFVWGSEFSEGFAAVQELSGHALIDANGVFLTRPGDFAMVADFSEGLARVSRNDKWGFINTAGEVVIPLVFDLVYDFINGQALAMKGKVPGYVMPDGEFKT
jgi:hypothetical protein